MGMATPDIGAAHKGYIYQDIATAFFMAERLAERSGGLVVDLKIVDDDRFDDVAVCSGHGRVRRQFKHSENADRRLERADLTQDRHDLRIDRLIRTFQREGRDAADEYRLCLTWLCPDDADLLTRLTEDASPASSFPGHRTRTFRLNV